MPDEPTAPDDEQDDSTVRDVPDDQLEDVAGGVAPPLDGYGA